MQNSKKGKLWANGANVIPWKMLCVDIIVLQKILINGKNPLILKSVTMINTIMGWFEIMQYNDKKLVTITNLVEICARPGNTGLYKSLW